jgi:hypothetical protein
MLGVHSDAVQKVLVWTMEKWNEKEKKKCHQKQEIIGGTQRISKLMKEKKMCRAEIRKRSGA